MRRTTLVAGLAVALAVFGTAPAHAGREAVTAAGLETDAAASRSASTTEHRV